MNHINQANMKKISVVNLDKLLDDFSQIEKKISAINGKNSLLDLQLEKCNRLLTLSQSKEDSVKEEYATLQNVIKGLRQTIENQCNLRVELKEEEHKEELEKKELVILDLTRQLRTQDKEKQNEIIKLQIEFNAKLARVQNKTIRSYPDTTVLPQNIYRRKLQHLQEEKNKEIEILRNTIRVLEQRLSSGPDSILKRRRL
ncbi:coiled-coil domain-containing protein 152 [Emydura macquarii macquarii]|uniref:coiled-coil domain-containing protein 152 n=1 Tax=Emydura macquarii macquarii TaxID=1129001 RepID=UPI00352BA212